MKFLLVLILFAVATYFLVRLVQERGLPGSSGSGGGRGNLPGRPQGPRGPSRPRPPAPRGPDDDDDFLRELDRKRRSKREDSDG